MSEKFSRVQLQRNYVESLVDGMDISELCMLVADMLHEKFEDLTDDELIEEVKEYQPHLLD